MIEQCRQCRKSQLNGGDCPLIWKDNRCRGFLNKAAMKGKRK